MIAPCGLKAFHSATNASARRLDWPWLEKRLVLSWRRVFMGSSVVVYASI
jgi:hypothetical protein